MAIFQLYLRRKSDDLRNEGLTFDALARDYEKWLRFCFENLDLDIMDNPIGYDIEQIQKKENAPQREYLAFCILNAMFERAYLLYEAHDVDFRKSQWENGWEETIKFYAQRQNFKDFWATNGGFNWDKRFVQYMKNKHQLGPI